MFTSTDGQPLRRTNFRRRIWLPAVAASVGEPCRFHDLRHSHVAMLIAHGEHPKTIAARLGHASVRTVLDVYGHLYQGLDQAAADRLDGILSRQLPHRGLSVSRRWSGRYGPDAQQTPC